MTHQFFKAFNVFIGLLLLSTCTTSSTDKPSSETEDYCKDINFKRKTTLSEQIAPYASKLENHKTGVYVLDQGTEAMFTRAWLSEYAQKTIDVQYFIFTTDNIGLIAIDYLVRAADRGIKVRIIIDDIMLNADSKELLVLNAHPNISIKIYNPLANVGKNIVQKLTNLTLRFHAFNQRMHNKTFTVDNIVSITGGRNIADEYFGYDHQYNFRDRDVLLVGEAPKQIKKSFDQFWEDELSVPVTQLLKSSATSNTKPNFEKLHQYACDPTNFLPEIREQIAMMPSAFNYAVNHDQVHWLENVEYVSDAPGKNDGKTFLGGSGIATDRLITLIQQAKHSVTIQTPYLVTTDLGKSILKELVARGVEVKILTNSLASNDNFEAFSGYQRDRKKLLQTGVKIFEFKPDAKIRQKVMSKEMTQQLTKDPIFTLHAKSMVIDDDITVIGTFNLDPRSANLNTESITIIPSIKVSKEVKTMMDIEMSADNAWETTLDWNPDGEVELSKRFKVRTRVFVPKSIL